MRKSITLYGLTFSLPMLIWQVLFFLAPLVFLVALSFWTVKNFRMEPDFNPDNWVRMLGRGVFWDAYFRTLWLSAAAAIITSLWHSLAPMASPSSFGDRTALGSVSDGHPVLHVAIWCASIPGRYSCPTTASSTRSSPMLGLGPFGMLNYHLRHDGRLPDA